MGLRAVTMTAGRTRDRRTQRELTRSPLTRSRQARRATREPRAEDADARRPRSAPVAIAVGLPVALALAIGSAALRARRLDAPGPSASRPAARGAALVRAGAGLTPRAWRSGSGAGRYLHWRGSRHQ